MSSDDESCSSSEGYPMSPYNVEVDYWSGNDEEEKSLPDEEDDDDVGTMADEESWSIRTKTYFGDNTLNLPRDDRPIVLGHTRTRRPVEGEDYFPRYDDEMNDPFTEDCDYINLGTMPHGSDKSTIIRNLELAIAHGDQEHTASCMIALFELFVSANRTCRYPVTTEYAEHRHFHTIQTVGPFSNMHAYSIHQMIWTTIRTIYLDQVGMGSLTACIELQALWENYEKYLFCLPYLSLSWLLGIGNLLCHAYKDGTVFYSYECWADTAQDRQWRAEVLRKPDVLSLAVEKSSHQRVVDLLSSRKVYYNNRSRLSRYQKDAIRFPHPEYIMQGKAMTQTNFRKFFGKRVLDTAKRERGSDERLQDTIQLLRQWVETEYRKVNVFHSMDASHDIEIKVALLGYFIRECVLIPDMWAIEGETPIDIADRLMARAPVHILPDYAHRLRRSMRGPMFYGHRDGFKFFPKYGIVGTDVVFRRDPNVHAFALATAAAASSSSMVSRSSKTARLTSERIASLKHPVPQTIFKAHLRHYPGSLEQDGLLGPNQTILGNTNYSLQPFLDYGAQLYYAKKNWQKLEAVARQNRAEERLKIMDDQAFIDYTGGMRWFSEQGGDIGGWCLVHINTKPSTDMHADAEGREDGGDGDAEDQNTTRKKRPKSVNADTTGTKKKKPKASADSNPTKSLSSSSPTDPFVEFKDIEEAEFWKETLENNSLRKNFAKTVALLRGPYPISKQAHLEQMIQETRDILEKDGMTGSTEVYTKKMLISRFPVKNKLSTSGIRLGRPAVFIVMVPYQPAVSGRVIMTLHHFHVLLQKVCVDEKMVKRVFDSVVDEKATSTLKGLHAKRSAGKSHLHIRQSFVSFVPETKTKQEEGGKKRCQLMFRNVVISPILDEDGDYPLYASVDAKTLSQQLENLDGSM